MGAPARTVEVTPDFRAGIRLLARLARVAEQACQSTGISLPQYRLLVSISGRPQRASVLATRVGVSRPTLTSLVDGLEQGGLLRRAPVPSDRRGIQLIPTEAGQRAITLAEDALSQRLLERFDRNMIKVTSDILAELDAVLEREGEVVSED